MEQSSEGKEQLWRPEIMLLVTGTRLASGAVLSKTTIFQYSAGEDNGN